MELTTKLAIDYLVRQKVSVIIGFKAEGGALQPKHDDSYVYNNHFDYVDFVGPDGTPITIPTGKFNISYEAAE